MKILDPAVELLHITPDAADVIERAGRVCWKSESRITDGSSTKFIQSLVDRGHESVLEHASAGFRIICDRGISHEIVRHRIASYSQESTRYCNYSKAQFGAEISVIRPPGLGKEELKLWEDTCLTAERAYFDMIDDGVAPEIARSVLPTCLKTELIMTANFRSWRNFIKLRTAKSAHPQIRIIALAIHGVLLVECPSCFNL